ncbi:MAG: ribonuclease III [Pseudomonadales bacterium]|nr:ribonuclease III [Pseudomonadales bacterium]
MKRVAVLEARIGFEFKNRSLAELALTHRSSGPIHNERLEFLGDAILGFAVAEFLFKKFPDASEGELSRLRSRLVNREILAEIAQKMDIGALLVLGPGEIKSGGRKRASILADALEAVFGAICLDAGQAVCIDRIQGILKTYVPETITLDETRDPKTMLQELLQAKSCEVPVYRVVELAGEAHNQKFVVECSVALLTEKTIGHGKNRRLAEQEAAQAALHELLQKGISHPQGSPEK